MMMQSKLSYLVLRLFDSDLPRPSGKGADKSLKRSADAMDEDAPSTGGELSKKQKKKLNKKLKNETGEAVAVTTTIKEVTSEVGSPDGKKDKKEDKKDKKNKEAKKDGKSSGKPEKQTLPSGLVIEDHKKGGGKAAKNGSTIGMRYIGKLENGKVFDSNTKGKPVRHCSSDCMVKTPR